MPRRDDEATVRLEGWTFQIAKTKAVCLRPPYGGRNDDVWFPYSQIVSSDPDLEAEEPERDEKVNLEITEWIANAKGIRHENGMAVTPGGPRAQPGGAHEAKPDAASADRVRRALANVTEATARNAKAIEAMNRHVSALIRSSAALLRAIEGITSGLGLPPSHDIFAHTNDALAEAKKAMSTHPLDNPRPKPPPDTLPPDQEGDDDEDIPF